MRGEFGAWHDQLRSPLARLLAVKRLGVNHERQSVSRGGQPDEIRKAEAATLRPNTCPQPRWLLQVVLDIVLEAHPRAPQRRVPGDHLAQLRLHRAEHVRLVVVVVVVVVLVQ